MDLANRLSAMRRSLDGLALGDSLGHAICSAPPSDLSFDAAPWTYTDDTEMAIAIVEQLSARGRIEQDELAREATLSAAVTHAHPEGQAGAAAVALAAAVAATSPSADRTDLRAIAERLAPGEMRDLLARAAEIGDVSPKEAGAILGTGLRVTAQDTVPYALWCAFGHLRDYRAAQLAAIEGFASPASDRDTICAIVGGTVALSCEASSIPAEWLAHREPLPDWVLPVSRV